jgi:hypothetical protein
MRTYKDLQAEQAAAQEEGRCRTEFQKLCQRLPALAPIEANFHVLLDYFEDSLKFDYAAAEAAIVNDPALVKMLAVVTPEQLETDRKQAIIDHNETMKAKSVDELRAELRQKHQTFINTNTPTPPDTLTRKAFQAASAEQMRQWIKFFTLPVLNEHFSRLEARERV